MSTKTKTPRSKTRVKLNPPEIAAHAELFGAEMASREATDRQDTPNDIENLQRLVTANFPDLWTAVELGLVVCATLALKHNANPAALVFQGGASSGKTTVVEMFAEHPITYLSDNFTPASFVGHAANTAQEDLATHDLLPKIQHKVLLTLEMAPIFRGKDVELTDRFSKLTRILDGKGYKSDSATQGGRGYRGDYLFAWLGCTTPIPPRVFRLMAQLGSRLFFLSMGDKEITVDDLLDSEEGASYAERLDLCHRGVHRFLTRFFTEHKVRSVAWDTNQDPRPVREWLARLAKLLAAMRSDPAWEGDPDRFTAYSPPKSEQPRRAYAVFGNLARAHALIHGRQQLTDEDLPLIAQVAISSMSDEYAKVFTAMVRAGGKLSVAQAQATLNVKHADTARKIMRDMDRHEVFTLTEQGVGIAAHLRFRDEWAWCASPEFRVILLGETTMGKVA